MFDIILLEEDDLSMIEELNLIKGIGPKTIKCLSKLNIHSINDLINYYPYRYEVLKRTNLNKIEDFNRVIIDGIIESNPQLYFFKNKINRMTFRLNTQNKIINIAIFNRAFLKNKLSIGANVIVIGKYDAAKNILTANELKSGALNKEITIEPIYHLTTGLSQKQISNFIMEALQKVDNVVDLVPSFYSEKYHFIDKMKSLRILHQPPNDINVFSQAKLRLVYEELFIYMLKMNYLKINNISKRGIKRNVSFNKVQELIDSLPYSLTQDQLKGVKEIYDDLNSGCVMNRLIQGDVGSGKTILSFIALYINYLSGYQGSLMAPTEILARQHYANILQLFDHLKIRVALLLGNTTKQDKRKIYEQIQNGEVDIIIGTHALLNETLTYKKLGLVITDEQHRFGVNQRNILINKGLNPDILSMSATPIPRTYAITLYGDMKVTNIKTKPKGRRDVITILKGDNEIKDILTMMYKELKANHQIYVIAPMIEEDDSLQSVKTLEQNMNKAFGKLYNIGILHGKMTNKEKEQMMKDFSKNNIQILISTTVIEVGVDVANATMIVIFDSYKFGLSTLHQLRGRVGRNSLTSYCLLVSSKETERLDILTKTNDGFLISEEDFKMRGSGDLFGFKQSGEVQFKLADLHHDFKILKQASIDSENLLKNKELAQDNKNIISKVLGDINILN